MNGDSSPCVCIQTKGYKSPFTKRIEKEKVQEKYFSHRETVAANALSTSVVNDKFPQFNVT